MKDENLTRCRYLVGFFFYDTVVRRTMFYAARKLRSTYTYPVPVPYTLDGFKKFSCFTGCVLIYSAHVPTQINPDWLSCTRFTSRRHTVNNNNIVVVIYHRLWLSLNIRRAMISFSQTPRGWRDRTEHNLCVYLKRHAIEGQWKSDNNSKS